MTDKVKLRIRSVANGFVVMDENTKLSGSTYYEEFIAVTVEDLNKIIAELAHDYISGKRKPYKEMER